MVNIFKLISTLGMVAAIAWFEMSTDFAAVMLGILCLSFFMMTFLVTSSDEQV